MLSVYTLKFDYSVINGIAAMHVHATNVGHYNDDAFNLIDVI